MKPCYYLLALLWLFAACGQEKKEAPVTLSEPEKNFLDESPEAKAERMAWWKEARFGMFIHWGLYAVPAGEYKGKRTEGIGEWIMDHLQIPIAEYEGFAPQFNPTSYNAREWVRIAKEAGMKYIVITSKHHDGFALWDSKVTEWDVVDATPYGKDLLLYLAEACEAEGIKLCFYHSIMDWHHPDAQAIYEPNYNKGRNDTVTNPNFPRYLENYMKPQLKELLTNYGDIGVLWFDGEWVPSYTSEQGKNIYNYVRSLQPNIIINNRVDKGRKGMEGLDAEGDFAGDFGTPEQEIPATGLPGLDWESCMTMNDTWGYKHFDDNWKSDTTLIRNLIDIVSKGGNFLLNVGPTAAGLIPEESETRLVAVGNWLKVYGEAIYGAEASPYERPDWGRFTQKGEVLYAHIFDWPSDGALTIPELTGASTARLLGQEGALKLSSGAAGTTVLLPAEAPHGIATVLAISLGEGS